MAPTESDATEPAVPPGLKKLSFKVDGLPEDSPLAALGEALRRVAGVGDAGVQRATRGARAAFAWVTYDPGRVSPEQLLGVVRRLGYAPVPMAESEKGNGGSR